MAGGLISAIIGPQLLNSLQQSNNTLFGNIFNCNFVKPDWSLLFLYLKIPLPRPEQINIMEVDLTANIENTGITCCYNLCNGSIRSDEFSNDINTASSSRLWLY